MSSNRYQVTSIQFSDGPMVTRDCDLLRVGEYPDKGLSIDHADLDRLAQSAGDIPLIHEHRGQRLRFGFLDGLRRVGDWLRGTARLFPDADSLLERCGVRGLSVGITPDKSALREVSVTETPRVAGATLFNYTPSVIYLGSTPQGGNTMGEQAQAAQQAVLEAKLAQMSADLERANTAAAQASERAERVEFTSRLMRPRQEWPTSRIANDGRRGGAHLEAGGVR